MRLQRCFCSLLCVCSASLIAFSAMSGLDADADVISIELTPAETLALYGSTIPAFYCANNNDYRETTLNYVGTVKGIFSAEKNNSYNTSSSLKKVLDSVSVANSYNYLVYSCSDVAYSDNSRNIQFQFQLKPSIEINCQQFITSLFYSVPQGNYSDSWNTVRWNWFKDDSTVSFMPNLSSSSSGNHNYFTSSVGSFSFDSFSNLSDMYFRGIPVYFYDEDSSFKVSSSECSLFNAVSVQLDGAEYSSYYFLLQCPVLSSGYVAGGSGSGGGTFNPEIVIANGYFDVDGNIELEIDLSQIIELLDYIAHRDGYDKMDDLVDAVNGVKDSVDDLKGSLADLIADAKESTKEAIDDGLSEGGPLSWIGDHIASAIAGIFIPSEDALTNFSDTMSDEFNSHLGGISEGIGYLSKFGSMISDAANDEWETIDFPEFTLSLPSGNYDDAGNMLMTDYTIIDEQEVKLRPFNEQGKLKEFWDALAYAIDIVCICAFLNMLHTKYEILLNPNGEVITYAS